MSDWYGLYREGWQGEIVPAAFSHPAKYARGLIRHIYRHLLDEGLVQPGDTVVDPFGGVALGALDAMRCGLHWTGIELEPRFVALGQQNIDRWLTQYAPHFPGWGTARIVQGDSRELAQVLGQAGACVSSPPYANQATNGARDNREANLTRAGIDASAWMGRCTQGRSDGYGTNPHNLGNLPPGDLGAALTSPPYSSGAEHGRSGPLDAGMFDRAPGKDGQTFTWQDYGSTPGQLGAMREGAAASVTSPPFSDSIGSDDPDKRGGLFRDPKRRNDTNLTGNYGTSTGQLGQESGTTFWTAARDIVAQLYQVLRPGAPAVFVVKSFVRKGKRVDFPGQWRQLCEACGFVPLHEHRAWLVEDRGAQWDIWGDLNHSTVERKSFFRRLAERKGAPRIDWETVLCMRRLP